MQIGPARPDDLAAIAALHAANWRQGYAGVLPEAALGAPLEAFMAARWRSEALRADAVLAAWRDGRLIGFAAMEPDGAGGLHLDNLHVAASDRGGGAGRALMAAVARRAGAGALWLTVVETNHAARALYRRWGGREGPGVADRLLGCPVTMRRVDWQSGDALAARLARGTAAR